LGKVLKSERGKGGKGRERKVKKKREGITKEKGRI
jgi:hypothetical protein